MKAIFVSNDIVPKLFSVLFRSTIYAIALWPFIFVRVHRENDAILVNHELIHIAQYRELLFFLGVALYVLDFIVGLIKYRDVYLAYRMIRFEQEAYNNQHDLEYWRKRDRFAWRKYNV
jgi:hypothetical protein